MTILEIIRQSRAPMMVVNIILMRVPPEKCKELSQTVSSLTGSIKTENGCLRCEFFQSLDDANILCLLEEWETREHLDTHMRSENLVVLRGATNLLVKPWEILSLTTFQQLPVPENELSTC